MARERAHFLPTLSRRRGWQWIGVSEADADEAASCEACGYTPLRWVHHLYHQEAGEGLNVGCVCAEHLTQDYVTPMATEKAEKSKKTRRARFIEKGWKTSKQGNLWRNYHDQHIVLFRYRDGAWGAKVGEIFGRANRPVPTFEQAAGAVFDALERQGQE